MSVDGIRGIFEQMHTAARQEVFAPRPEGPEAKQIRQAEAFRLAVARQRAVFDEITDLLQGVEPVLNEDGTATRTKQFPTNIDLRAGHDRPAAWVIIELTTTQGPAPLPGFRERQACSVQYLFQEVDGGVVPGRTFTTGDIALHEGIAERPPRVQANVYQGYFTEGDAQGTGYYDLEQIELGVDSVGANPLPTQGADSKG